MAFDRVTGHSSCSPDFADVINAHSDALETLESGGGTFEDTLIVDRDGGPILEILDGHVVVKPDVGEPFIVQSGGVEFLRLIRNGSLRFLLPNLPTGDPGFANQLYREADGTLKVSDGP